jgi:hypothetical protein
MSEKTPRNSVRGTKIDKLSEFRSELFCGRENNSEQNAVVEISKIVSEKTTFEILANNFVR